MNFLDWPSQGKSLPCILDYKMWYLRDKGVVYEVQVYAHDLIVAQIASDLYRFSVRGAGATVQEALNQCDANIEVVFQTIKRPQPRPENTGDPQNEED